MQQIKNGHNSKNYDNVIMQFPKNVSNQFILEVKKTSLRGIYLRYPIRDVALCTLMLGKVLKEIETRFRYL